MEVREFVGFFLRQKKREHAVLGIVSILLTLASQKRKKLLKLLRRVII